MAEHVKDDGGQAFPQPVAISPAGDEHVAYPGMTLRDWFAGQALAGILAFPGSVDGDRNKSFRPVVRNAYAFADAMLAERSK